MAPLSRPVKTVLWRTPSPRTQFLWGGTMRVANQCLQGWTMAAIVHPHTNCAPRHNPRVTGSGTTDTDGSGGPLPPPPVRPHQAVVIKNAVGIKVSPGPGTLKRLFRNAYCISRELQFRKPPMENENASSPKYGALLKQTLSVERARQSPHFKEKAGG